MCLHHCYILINKENNSTYVGYTNNPERRLRQHNGHLKGGAKYTTSKLSTSEHENPWEFLLLISSTNPSFDKCKALSLEWHIKHETKKQKAKLFCDRRMLAMLNAFAMEKFADIQFDCFVCPSHYDTLSFMVSQYKCIQPLNMILYIMEVDQSP